DQLEGTRQMMCRAIGIVVAFFLVGFELTLAAAENACPTTLNSASPKSLYYLKADGSWEGFDSFQATEWQLGHNVDFAYIVREQFFGYRIGVRVVKSGRYTRWADPNRQLAA